ncbi:hypothetical protein KCP78_24395 [Salmonella enterica subsp. enterica]|nr:hypothetical protein KCP78_24395 [Salmonella enterica subsp. enterica]
MQSSAGQRWQWARQSPGAGCKNLKRLRGSPRRLYRRARTGTIGFATVRAGDIVGEHVPRCLPILASAYWRFQPHDVCKWRVK